LTRSLELKIGARRFVAELLEAEAPGTCGAIIKALPIRGKVIHARWSGEAMWLPMKDSGVEVPHENATSHPSRGELLFYPGFVSEKEILIPYGPSRFASKAGVLAGNHFATVREGLDGLAEVGSSVLWEGAKEAVIDAI